MEAVSSKIVESDAEVAMAHIAEDARDFHDEFIRLVEQRKTAVLRLEVRVENGKVTDIDVNRFTKRKPRADGKRK